MIKIRMVALCIEHVHITTKNVLTILTENSIHARVITSFNKHKQSQKTFNNSARKPISSTQDGDKVATLLVTLARTARHAH